MRPIPRLEDGGQAQPVQLGKYVLLGAIGRGGMADVYLAIARGPVGVRKLVVVKRVRAGNDLDGALSQMFLDEGRLAALLNHTNVVHTYEVGLSEDGPYIVMEYLHGQPLSAIARAAKPVDPRLSARIAADALSGLHYAHEVRDLDGTPLSIVHRDLSPPNIFVTHDGVVKLVDFGIAKTAVTTRAATEAGLVKGKLAYMAPEQATSGDVDRRADIYAMGVVLWELLAGRRLVEDPSPASIFRHTLHGNTPRVSSIRAEIDEALDGIVERALRRDPDARYATALEMREDLENYLARGSAVGAKELSHLMAEHFTAQREEREQRIQSWVAAFTAERPSAFELAMRRETPGDEPPLEQISGAIDVTQRTPLAAPFTRRRRLRRALVVAAGIALALALFAFHESDTADPRPTRAIDPTVTSARASSPTAARSTASSPETLTVAPSVAPPLVKTTTASKAPLASKRSRTTEVAAPRPTPKASSTPKASPTPRASPTLERNPYLHSQ